MTTPRKKLIFFASADPAENPKPAWSAYHFAEVATKAGLDAEVRLAGDAVRVARPELMAASPRAEDLREKVRSGAGRFFVSL